MTLEQTPVVFRASDTEAVLVDRAAARLGVSKSRFLRLAIARRVDEVMAIAADNPKASKCSETADSVGDT